VVKGASLIQGLQISAPFGNVKYALEVFEALDEFAKRSVESDDSVRVAL
jgi:hypothetical protein